MGKESSSRRSGRRSKSDSDSDEDSRDSSPRRKSRKKRSSSSSRRRHSSSESEGSDFDHRKRHRRKSSRNITEEEINEYMAKKAQRKALKVAKKLKSQTISGYSNDSNPFGDANLKEKPFLVKAHSSKPMVYWWHDKYRPRKPKYFNRVHTGYEWNKYNQTHYDHDNPPPKIVQGYKFNIFYPDLVEKTKAPGYTIEKDGSNGETCLIRFHAGPPYEDIAFKIVNKEWEYSHKKGFKCTFERGILHVYFNFKRYRYRR